MVAEQVEPNGIPPVGRYMHAACFIDKYLVIHGGKNTSLYTEIHNVALNDMHLYDILQNTWCKIVIYGIMPESRWGHQLASS